MSVQGTEQTVFKLGQPGTETGSVLCGTGPGEGEADSEVTDKE